ncbi:MAG TPA: putative metallopeptidase [Synergistaceae bacterium]|nr:MAG: hypothetical protein BWY88_00748 [Synergistetes bacterium ADurb.Bin520]HQF91967.1 putative metallopeptidase [Synergistaceae bacterium]HQH77350.1 putative metallopeptidase [Synergistaceae bacterium]HQK25310.1 putative metallopeptidase [Synergistaceae bacterium]
MEEIFGFEVCNERFRPMAEALRRKYEELRHVDPESVLFLMNRKSLGKQKKRVVLARTSKVPPKWQEVLYQLGGGSYFFMVEFYEKSLEPLDQAQITALIYHELRKITPEGGVVPPDVHDWYQMIQGLGRHWFYPDATCPDLLAEGVDWKKLMGSFYEAPHPSES